MLHDFIRLHRAELIARTRVKVAQRAAPRATEDELEKGVPRFLTQLERILVHEAAGSDVEEDSTVLERSASAHGGELLRDGLSVGQVVHDYGDVCQAVTDLATERGAQIGITELRTLNRCVDDAIASAVTEYISAREASTSAIEVERVGFLAHELRNALGSAVLAFHALKSGRVPVGGSTGAVLERSLTTMGRLVERSMAEVRLNVGVVHAERVQVARLVDEAGIVASMEATKRRLALVIDCAGRAAAVEVEVDRLLVGSAISNLLHNALKFTRPPGTVELRVSVAADHAVIEVEDQCGGLPPGAEQLFEPFHQHAADKTGLGLGLTISRRGVESCGGTITVRDLPGRGCVFAVRLPLATHTATAAPA